MLDIIQYKDIKKYKRYIPFDICTNSKLYYDKDLIHKIFFYKTMDFNKILEILDELKLEELVEIKKLIYRNGFVVGYSIKNYKEYKSLRKFKNRKFDLKKQDCFKLVESFDTLLKNNLSCIDFHQSNILLNHKDGDIKICDLDSLILVRSNADKQIGLKNLLILILSYLYNIKYNHIRNVIISGDNIIDNTFIGSCRTKNKDITLEHIKNVIQNIKYENVKNEKRLIISKSKALIDTGYSKFL